MKVFPWRGAEGEPRQPRATFPSVMVTLDGKKRAKALRKDWAEETFVRALKSCCAHVDLFPEEFRFVSMKLDLLSDRK